MTFATVSEPAATTDEAPRPRGRIEAPHDQRLALLRAAGNRATERALARRTAPRRQVARCAGACHCGGTCGGPTEADEELLASGQHALRRAVLARDRRTAPDPPAPAPASGSGSAPSPTQSCGPDVSQAVRDIVAKTRTDYASWTHVQKDEACAALENVHCAGDAWDIVELHNRDWLDSYTPCAEKSGPCKNTVKVDGSCSYAGSVNYVIFGAQCKLCDIWKSTMEDMIWAYKGHVPFVHPASPNYGPSLQWARAGYDGWPAGATSPAGDRPSCTGDCPTAYTSGPMHLHWYPTSPTETVGASCAEWAREYHAFLTTPPDYTWGGGMGF